MRKVIVLIVVFMVFTVPADASRMCWFDEAIGICICRLGSSGGWSSLIYVPCDKLDWKKLHIYRDPDGYTYCKDCERLTREEYQRIIEGGNINSP